MATTRSPRHLQQGKILGILTSHLEAGICPPQPSSASLFHINTGSRTTALLKGLGRSNPAELPGAVGIPTRFAKFIGICHPDLSSCRHLRRIYFITRPLSKNTEAPRMLHRSWRVFGIFPRCQDALERRCFPGIALQGAGRLLPLQGSVPYAMCDPPGAIPTLNPCENKQIARGEEKIPTGANPGNYGNARQPRGNYGNAHLR